MKELNCNFCGKVFRSYNPNPKYCSRPCKYQGTRMNIDIAEVERLYSIGHTQEEIAQMLGVSQKVIHLSMKRNGLRTRIPAKRNQLREANSSWKGERAGYSAFHRRLEAARGKPKQCEICGTSDPAKHYDWANLTGDYSNPNDFKRMCRSCHWKYDHKGRNFKGAVGGRRSIPC